MNNSETPSESDEEGGPIDIALDQGFHFVTSNDAKYRAAVDEFGSAVALEQARIDVPEIQSTSPEEVVTQKAEAAYRAVGSPVVVDDFSFFMDGLNNFPGPLIKHLLKETGLRGLEGLSQVANDGCTVQCTVAMYTRDACIVVHGDLRGRLRLASNYADPSSNMLLSTVFVPDGYDLPLSELRIETHRQKAYSNLKASVSR